jgi:hypothetical protein
MTPKKLKIIVIYGEIFFLFKISPQTTINYSKILFFSQIII